MGHQNFSRTDIDGEFEQISFLFTPKQREFPSMNKRAAGISVKPTGRVSDGEVMMIQYPMVKVTWTTPLSI